MTGLLIEASSLEPEDEEFDSPNGSKWIVAVDECGLVVILDRPNIHYGFFDGGEGAEEIGLPFELSDTPPGVYEWICDYSQSYDYESGIPDGGEFEVREQKCLWSVPQ